MRYAVLPLEMCGRTFCTLDPQCILRNCAYSYNGETLYPEWKDAPTGECFKPSTNIGPTIFTPVLISASHLPGGEQGKRVMQPMRWGLIPSWHQGDRMSFKTMHNNCRGETLLEKTTFAGPFRKGRRCVVIAEGFYEWKTTGNKKSPYMFVLNDFSIIKKPKTDDAKVCIKDELKPAESKIVIKEEPKTEEDKVNIKAELRGAGCKISIKNDPQEPLPTDGYTNADALKFQRSSVICMAGIFDIFHENNGKQLYSYTVITAESVGAVAKVHHRMPVILETEAEVERWLNYAAYPALEVMDLVKAKDCLKGYEVTEKVSNVRYQEPDCCLPKELAQKSSPLKNDIRNWFTSSATSKRKVSDEQTDSKKSKFLQDS